MNDNRLTMDAIDKFAGFLRQEERSAATVEKYARDVLAFYHFLPMDKQVTKERVLAYKQNLSETYRATSANSMLVALNRLFTFLNREDCRVKLFKVQRRCFRDQARELSRQEYLRLVRTAKARQGDWLYLLIQTLCCTGIRVSEHRFITLEAVRCGRAEVSCKGKQRTVFLPPEIQNPLLQYCLQNKIVSGPIFVNRNGLPINRSRIWLEMKKLAEQANIAPEKVFPHNLRHLFAVTFYQQEKDIVRLADFLGHASIDTTRIYTCSSGEEHVAALSRLGLVI